MSYKKDRVVFWVGMPMAIAVMATTGVSAYVLWGKGLNSFAIAAVPYFVFGYLFFFFKIGTEERAKGVTSWTWFKLLCRPDNKLGNIWFFIVCFLMFDPLSSLLWPWFVSFLVVDKLCDRFLSESP